MKTLSKTLLTTCIMMSVLAVHAQVGFQIGWEAGAGVSWASGNKVMRQLNNPRDSYSGGLLGQIDFRRKVGLRTGLMYDLHGTSYAMQLNDPVDQSLVTIHGRQRFDLLTVPVLVRLTLGKRLRYFAEAGPYVNFILRVTTRSAAVGNFPAIRTDWTSGFKAAQLGIASGLGLTFAFTDAIWFSCTLRAHVGLTNASALPVFGDGAIRTNAANVLLGACYRFEVAKSRRTALLR